MTSERITDEAARALIEKLRGIPAEPEPDSWPFELQDQAAQAIEVLIADRNYLRRMLQLEIEQARELAERAETPEP